MVRNMIDLQAIRIVILALLLAACSGGVGSRLPSADEIVIPAIGTPIPAGRESGPIDLSSDVSGVLLVNRTNTVVRVVVSNTLAIVPAAESFLFVLPAGVYPFYIYDLAPTPQLYSEQTELGKVRYVYLMPPPK